MPAPNPTPQLTYLKYTCKPSATREAVVLANLPPDKASWLGWLCSHIREGARCCEADQQGREDD